MPLVGDIELEQLRFPMPKVNTQTHTHTRFSNPEAVFMSPGYINALFPVCVCVYLQGVLRIHFLEAQNLEGKDKFFGGLIKGKSDPYGVVQVANQIFQSKTIKECLNPKWNEVFEVSVYNVEWDIESVVI